MWVFARHFYYVTQIIVSIPLIILYEISLVLSKIVYRKKKVSMQITT